MQKLYDVDEYDPLTEIVANNTQDANETKNYSTVTHCTVRTASSESSEDNTVLDDKNDSNESGSATTAMHEMLIEQDDTGECEQRATSELETKKGKFRNPIRKVRWGSVEMRMHPVIPGDHPDTREGPPLTLDWEILSEHKMDIDGYEAKRPPRLRDIGQDLRIGSIDRLNLLRRVGVQEEDINHSMTSARITRKQRLRTSEPWRRQFFKVEEVQEKILRKIAKVMNPERNTKLITRY